MDRVMAIIGICGGLLCAVADCLLDLKGADNKKLGKGGYIDSKWMEMSHARFVASGILVMFHFLHSIVCLLLFQQALSYMPL